MLSTRRPDGAESCGGSPFGHPPYRAGEIKRKDNLNIWVFKHYPEHSDNLLCVAAVISQAVMTELEREGDSLMKIIYYEDDDILFIEFSKDRIVHDESLNWNVNIGYTKDGIGEITILEAKEKGYYPFEFEKTMRHAA